MSPPHAAPTGTVPPLRDGLLAALCTLMACALITPATINGDGLGYIRTMHDWRMVPGHLLYRPLLAVASRIAHARTPLDDVTAGRCLSYLAAAAAVLFTQRFAGRVLVGAAGAVRGAAAIAALGLGVSWATLQAGSDVESYAPALAALCLAAWSAAEHRHATTRGAWVVATATAIALAALIHVENVLFAPAAALLADRADEPRPRRARTALAILALSGALVLGSYVLPVLILHEPGFAPLRWASGASHGFAYPIHWYTPAAAVYGIARSLVVAPYPFEASWARVVAQVLLGMASVGVMLALARRRDRLRGVGRRATLAWIAPYAAIGLVWFGSDNERWIFLLPLAWTLAGAGAVSSPRAFRTAAATVAALLALNLGLALPAARDSSMRDRADAAARFLADGDLVISPGHDWDEYIGFYHPVAVREYPLVYFAGALRSDEPGGGATGPLRLSLAEFIRFTREMKHRVFLARAHDPESSAGWKDLALLGIHPADLDALLPPGHRVPVAPDLERFDPP